MLVANHSSHLDAPALLSALPLKKIHRAFPAAASDYFFTSLPTLAFPAVVVNAMQSQVTEDLKGDGEAHTRLILDEVRGLRQELEALRKASLR